MEQSDACNGSDQSNSRDQLRKIVEILKNLACEVDLARINKTFLENPHDEQFSSEDHDTLLYLNMMKFIREIETTRSGVNVAQWEWFFQVLGYFKIPLSKVFAPDQLKLFWMEIARAEDARYLGEQEN